MNTAAMKPLPPPPRITEETAIRRALLQRYGFEKVTIHNGWITGHHVGNTHGHRWTVKCGHRADYTTADYNGHGIQVHERGHMIGTVYGRIKLPKRDSAPSRCR